MQLSDIAWILDRLNVFAILDILLVALVFFGILMLVRATQAIPLLRGILVLVVLSFLLGGLAQLPTFSLVARTIVPVLLVAIPVIFQPELRRALERLGRFGDVMGTSRNALDETQLHAISNAARSLSNLRYGALMVVEGKTGLQNLIETGVQINAHVSSELLVSMFYPNTPLHDGGVIIHENQIVAAGCVLPLTGAHLDDVRLGLRHRAGLGVTEGTDAVAVIVSEETGSISIAREGSLIRNIQHDELDEMLASVLQPNSARNKSLFPRLLQIKK